MGWGFKKKIKIILGIEVGDKDPQSSSPGASLKNGIENVMQKLVELNIVIRVESFPKNVVEDIENIIDKLRNILPEINEKFPGSDLTWVVNKMASGYLPKVVKEYADLTVANRENKVPEIIESLRVLNDKLDNIIKLVHDQEVSEFDSEAKFLRIKFFQEKDLQEH